MSAPAAFRATYSDLKFIKSRKVAMVIVELPIEEAARFVEAFGTPDPSKETWVAIARLDLSKAGDAEKPRRSWSELKPSAQAAIRCGEPAFRRWLAKDDPQFQMYDLDMAADAVRERCDIHSRAHLDTNKQAAAVWQRMEMEYQEWRRHL